MTRIRTVGRVCAALAALTLGAGTLAGCGGGRENITVAGSTAFQPFAEKLADLYMQTNAAVNVTVQGGGSAVGIQSAQSGAAQIGMADLVTLPAEAEGLVATVVAKDGVAIVVHPSNPVADLTTAQVRDIFNGTIANWSAVGGPDKAITVTSREAGSGTRKSFEAVVGGLQLTDTAIIQNSSGSIRATVASNDSAIGYLSHGVLNEEIKALNVDGVACTEATMLGGQYKLVRPVFFLTKGAPAPAAKAFIDYVLSAEGQKTIKESGLLPAK